MLRFKAKDLMDMPALLALALQADGWWIRSDIIWAKPNPMPESVTDRPTNAHEHVFLLTKSARYFFDQEAVREEALQPIGIATRTPNCDYTAGGFTTNGTGNSTLGANQGASSRNCRNVWFIATHAFPEAHFATFPPALAERCIKAGTSERGCCAHCGKPWVRQTAQGAPDLAHQRACGGDANGEYHGQSTKGHAAAGVQDASAVKARILAGMREVTTTGWSPACRCIQKHATRDNHANVSTVPCTVLDPFAGAGTTGLVADRLQRDAVMIELNEAYCTMLRNRIESEAPLFTEFTSYPPASDPEDERMRDLFAGDEYQRLAPEPRKPFRTGANYLNQSGVVSNGLPEAAE